MEGDEENSQGKGNIVVDDGGKSVSANLEVGITVSSEIMSTTSQTHDQEPVITTETGSSSSARHHDHDSNPEKKKESTYFREKIAHLEPELEMSRDCKDEDWGKDIEALQQCYEMGGDENSLIQHHSSYFQEVRVDLGGVCFNGNNPAAEIPAAEIPDGSEDIFGEFDLEGLSKYLDSKGDYGGDVDPNTDYVKVLDGILDDYSKCGISEFSVPYSEVLEMIKERKNSQHDHDSNPEKKKGSAYSIEMRAHLEPKLKLLRDCKDEVEGLEEHIEALQQCYELGDDDNSLIQHQSPSFLKVSAELDGNLRSLKVSIDKKKVLLEQNYKGLEMGENAHEPSVTSWVENTRMSIALETEKIQALKKQVYMGCKFVIEYYADNAGKSMAVEVQQETTSAAAAEEGFEGNNLVNIGIQGNNIVNNDASPPPVLAGGAGIQGNNVVNNNANPPPVLVEEEISPLPIIRAKIRPVTIRNINELVKDWTVWIDVNQPVLWLKRDVIQHCAGFQIRNQHLIATNGTVLLDNASIAEYTHGYEDINEPLYLEVSPRDARVGFLSHLGENGSVELPISVHDPVLLIFNKVCELGGTIPALLGEKRLTITDVSRHHSRVLLPQQALISFLTVDEYTYLRSVNHEGHRNSVMVPVVNPRGEISEMKFRIWVGLVLSGRNWNEFVEKFNTEEVRPRLQFWCFRIINFDSQRLGFAINEVT